MDIHAWHFLAPGLEQVLGMGNDNWWRVIMRKVSPIIIVNRASLAAFESLVVWSGGSSMLLGTILALVPGAELKRDGTNP